MIDKLFEMINQEFKAQEKKCCQISGSVADWGGANVTRFLRMRAQFLLCLITQGLNQKGENPRFTNILHYTQKKQMTVYNIFLHYPKAL